MKRISILLTILLAAAGLIAAVAAQAPASGARQPATASAAPAAGFTYQGVLTDGSSPANGRYDFQFALFDAETGGVQAGGTLTHTDVAVADGLFTVNLDFGAAALDGGPRFLEVRVWNGSAYETLLPRQPIRPAPIATTLAAEMAPPAVVTATAVSGGSLPSGAYYFKIVAAGGGGATVGSAEAACTVDGVTTNLCRLDWTAVSGATAYRVYKGSTPGGQDRYQETAANTYAYNTDNGATLGTVPTMTTAFASHISPAGDSWLLDGNLGLGRVPEVDLDVYGAIRAGDPGLGPNTNGALVIGTSTNGGRIVWSTDGDGYIYNDYGPTVVLGSDSNTQFAFRVNGQASTNRFTVRADGNVGIGTAQPADRLHVRGNAIIEHQGVGLVLQRAGYDEWLLGQIATGFAIHNSTDNRNDIVIDGSGNVGIGTANPVASLEVNGGIRSSGGSPGIGGTANNGYAFSGNGGDNDSGMFSSADAQLEFYTDNVERARFNYGNFGIGTTTPAAPLDVHVATNTDAIVATRDDVNPPRLELGFETVSGFPTIQATRGGGPWDLLLNPLVGGGGAVGINTTTPGAALQVGSPGDGSQALANAWNTFSDGRFKTHVAPLTNALDLLTAIDGVQFTWAESGSPSIGFIAQDVEAVLPQIVTTDANGYKSLDYARLTPLLVEALKDQQDDIGALRLENTQLHETNTRLQTEIAAIHAQVAGASPAAAAWRWLDALQTCALLAGAAFFFWSRRAQKNVRK